VDPAGFIEATSGNVVDYGAIEQRILADAELFQVKEIAYDPWNATHIALRLQDEGATRSSSARASARWRRRPASSRS
jgi:phage terminase large subunit-like protein